MRLGHAEVRGGRGIALTAVLLLVAVILVGPGYTAVARQGTPAAESTDPCAAIVAAGTPAAEGGSGGMGALDPVPGEQTGELGNPADYPFDVVFLDGMIAHHQGAILLAEIALVRAEHEELRALARAILDAQSAEVAEMTAWRAAWYGDAAPVPPNVIVGLMDEGLMRLGGPADMGHAMGGGPVMGASDDAHRLCTATGSFDLAFIDVMTPHHQSAIGMALLAQERAEHPELKTLAEAVISSQEGEIAQMTAWRDAWSAAGNATPAASAGQAHGGGGNDQETTTAATDEAPSLYVGVISRSGSIRSLTPDQIEAYQVLRGDQ